MKWLKNIFTDGPEAGGPPPVPDYQNLTGEALQTLKSELSDELSRLWEQENLAQSGNVTERTSAKMGRHERITSLTDAVVGIEKMASPAVVRMKTGAIIPTLAAATAGPWPFYDIDGTYVGTGRQGTVGDDLAFVGNASRASGTLRVSNIRQLTTNHTQFQTSANIVKLEGTSQDTEEYLWIAHTANNNAVARGRTLYNQLNSSYSSVPRSEKVPLPTSNNTTTAKAARAGVIDVLLGNPDPTFGSRYWDGTDLIAWGLNSPNGTPQNKFEEYSLLFIDEATFNKYLAAQRAKWGASVRYSGTRYTIPAAVFDITQNPGNWGTYANSPNGRTYGFLYNTGVTGEPALLATGSYGESVFWTTRR